MAPADASGDALAARDGQTVTAVVEPEKSASAAFLPQFVVRGPTFARIRVTGDIVSAFC